MPFPQLAVPQLLSRLGHWRDTFPMRVPAKLALLCAASCLTAVTAFSDEIRLKDGKKLYGVIVAYEDNMFKIKTDFGFVLVEKDKIASIIPTTPASATPASSNSTTGAKPAKSLTKPANSEAPKPSAANTTQNNSVVATETPALPSPAKPKLSAEPIRPQLPATSSAGNITPPAIKSAAPASSAIATAPLAAPAKEPEPPANREQVQGTLYTNFSHGFRMYKAPSWEIIEDARRALPNAIVAMGTSNESTLMVVGQEPVKDSLDVSANGVEKRLREIYENYRMISRRKTVVGGSPAVEYKFSGKAEEHAWSGTLVVVSREKDLLTILGMTYADNDLIQIQENVIARAISSTDFNVHQ